MTIFALTTRPWVLEAMGEELLNPLLDRAVERLRTRYPKTERRQNAIVVDADAYSAAVQLLATEEPYRLDTGLMFLPFACRSGSTVEDAINMAEQVRVLPVLRWHGSMEASRQMIAVGETMLGAGAVSLQPSGHHVYYARATEDDDVITLWDGGAPLRRWRSFPQVIFIARKSAPAQAWTYVLFEDARGIVWFSHNSSSSSFGRYELIHAEMRGIGRSLAIVDQPPEDFRPKAANLTVSTSWREKRQLVIVATGDHDALVVFGDQLREQFAGHKLVIGIANDGEPTAAFYKRITAELGV